MKAKMRFGFILILSCLMVQSQTLGQDLSTPLVSPHDDEKKWLDKKIESMQVRSGFFGVQIVGAHKHGLAPSKVSPKVFHIEQLNQSIAHQKNRLSAVSLPTTKLHAVSDLSQQFTPPALSNFSVHDIQQLILTDAIKRHLQQQIQTWQSHYALHIDLVYSLQEIVDTRLNSWVDFEAMAQEIIAFANTYPWEELSSSHFSFSQIPWQSFYDQAAFKNLLNDIDDSWHHLEEQSQWAIQALEYTVKETLAQTFKQGQTILAQRGYTFSGSTVFFQDPSQLQDSFSFNAGLQKSKFYASGQSHSDHANGSFNATVGDYLHIEGDMTANFQGMTNGLETQAENIFEDLIIFLEEATQNPTSMGTFLSDLESFFQDIPQQEKETLLTMIKDNTDTDFALTLNLQNISDRFEGSGTYEYIDVILETLGNDLGSVSINKKQTLELLAMWSDDTSQSKLSEYVLSNILNIQTDVITYTVARDIVNGYLASHLQGNMIALQHSLSDGSGMIFQNQAIFGAAIIHQGDKTRWAITGSYNQPFMHEAPLIKKNGYLQAHSKLTSHSIGIAYIPKLWLSANRSSELSGIVQVEALFIQPHYVKIVSKNQREAQNVYELYNIPLDELDGAKETYTVPLLSAGLNLQHKVSPSLTISGYAIAYPSLKEKGSLKKIPSAMTAKFQSGFSLILHMQPQH